MHIPTIWQEQFLWMPQNERLLRMPQISRKKNHTHIKFLTFTRDKFLRMPQNHKKMRILTIWRKWFLQMPHISRKIYILPFCKNKKFLAKQSNQPEKLHYIFFVWICLRNCNKLSTKKFCSTKQQIYEYFTPYLQIFHFFSL